MSARWNMAEAEWQRQVTDLAELYRWTWAHFRTARTVAGWRTPVAGPGGAGFPDLILWRERVILVELKGDRTPVSAAQKAVLASLRAAGAEVHLWRPADFDVAHEVLRL